MKRIIVTTVISVMFFGTVMAQVPTTGAQSSEWTKVQSNAVPASIQQTLKSETYKGWDQSTAYYNKTAKQYAVDVKTGNTSTRYLFDANGQLIPGSGTQKSMGSIIPGKDPGTPPAINPNPSPNPTGGTPPQP